MISKYMLGVLAGEQYLGMVYSGRMLFEARKQLRTSMRIKMTEYYGELKKKKLFDLDLFSRDGDSESYSLPPFDGKQ